jgi:SPP1 gp7 family putative phage head morphogenesis protein
MSSWLKVISPDGSPPDKKAILTPYVPELDAGLAQTTEQLMASSWLLGMDHVGSTISLADSNDWEPLPFEDAVSFLKGRVSIKKEEWNDIEPKLRFRSFTMARLLHVDYIEAGRGQLLSALEKGDSFTETWKNMKAIAEEDGGQIDPKYWETVYRTNLQTCYNAGRRMEFDRNPPAALELIVLDDIRTSSICRPLIGVVLPYNHPFWKTRWPPFHFNCRTTVRGVYEEEVGTGINVDNTSMNTLRKRFKPQSGFGGNPLDNGNWWMMRESQILRGIKHGIITEFNRSDNVIYPPDYKKIWKGYSRTKGKNGGWYDLCETPPNDWDKNKPVVEFLAERGYQIKVIPAFQEVQGWKNPDVYINGVLADIKEPESPTVTAIKNQIQKAQKQKVGTVILNLGNIPSNVIKRGLKGRMGSPNNKVTRVYVVYNNLLYNLTEDMIKADNFGF